METKYQLIKNLDLKKDQMIKLGADMTQRIKYGGFMSNLQKVVILIAVLVSVVFFTSQTPPANNLNGFIADPGSFEILSSFQGKRNVLKVDGSKTRNSIVRYSLAQYTGKPITIEISADVWREKHTENLYWQVNNDPYFPAVAWVDNASPRVWHNLKGRLIVIPTANDPHIYITNWGEKNAQDIFYIANPTIIIQESGFGQDLTLTPLKQIYADHFLIGNITINDGLYMHGYYFNAFMRNYNAVTTNVTFPFQLAPPNKGGNYQWTNADRVVNLMRRNNIPIHGHVLVYHENNNPVWLTEGSRDEVLQNMNDYITTVLSHFKGLIDSWEVVNEVIKTPVTNAEARGDWRRCINNVGNSWYNKLGADYIELAFRFARIADSDIKLYYNDWGLENPNKAEVVRKMIEDINNRYKNETGGNRNLIEGVTSQAHIYSMNLNINDARASLEKLISLGIEVAISEMDVPTINWTHNNVGAGRDTVMSEREQIAQGIVYARLMNLYKEYSAHITRVTFWGMDDRNSWISRGNPTLFDWKLNPKQAFHAVSDPDSFLRQHGGNTRR